MIIKIDDALTFFLDSRRPNHLDYDLHTLTIWEADNGCGIELTLSDEELEKLRDVIKE